MIIKIGSHRSPREGRLLEIIEQCGSHVFNPSIRSHGSEYVVAARVSESKSAPVTACSFVVDGEMMQIRDGSKIDLSAWGERYGISKVADPKLFSYRDSVWVSFNTGFETTENSVYIASLYPSLGAPVRCEVPNRQAVEKNWGFFEGGGGELNAVYALDPLTILTFGEVSERGERSRLMADTIFQSEDPTCSGLTIGTQPIIDGNDLLLVAHERVGHSKFRGYFGRPVRLCHASERWTVAVSGARLVHGWLTMLGARHKRNKHLWFATYFAGIDKRDGQILATYGINDQRSGVARLDHALFPQLS